MLLCLLGICILFWFWLLFSSWLINIFGFKTTFTRSLQCRVRSEFHFGVCKTVLSLFRAVLSWCKCVWKRKGSYVLWGICSWKSLSALVKVLEICLPVFVQLPKRMSKFLCLDYPCLVACYGDPTVIPKAFIGGTVSIIHVWWLHLMTPWRHSTVIPKAFTEGIATVNYQAYE